ncbi:MAG TPA: hypothetical protein VHD76_22860 [Bryobacteraceae bacterium]|nr:hypothetical protein [Bryobacteraceae bacterium]
MPLRAARQVNASFAGYSLGASMAKKKFDYNKLPKENPEPTMPEYESFHCTAKMETSKRLAALLRDADVRFNETVWHQIGVPEYVIEVHRDDLAKASEVFGNDLGKGRTVTSTRRSSEPPS